MPVSHAITTAVVAGTVAGSSVSQHTGNITFTSIILTIIAMVFFYISFSSFFIVIDGHDEKNYKIISIISFLLFLLFAYFACN